MKCVTFLIKRPSVFSPARLSDLWAVLQSAGFDRALLPESKGGAGVSRPDACGHSAIFGGHAAAVPLAEPMIGHWLADRADIGDLGLPTIALPPHSEIRLSRDGDS
jgi:acyl-CoA dehydrogenase